MNAAPVASGRRILDSLGMPLFVFAAALTVLLTFSWAVVLPHFTRFEAGGRRLSASALLAYRGELERNIAEAEARRDELLLPAYGETYRALKIDRQARMDVDVIRGAINRSIEESIEEEDSIVLKNVRISGETGTVRIEGSVFARTRSMTVLAAFVERLRGSSIVREMTPPLFERRQDEKGVFFSPFVIEFSLLSPDTAS